MRVAYIRVSTIEQNEERQIKAFESMQIEKMFVEKASGKDQKGRPQLQQMLNFVREGDTVYVHDLSRLARSTKDLLSIAELLSQKGVALVSLKENVDSATPTGKLMLTMIGAIAEFERTNMLERQREGIAIQKALDQTRAPAERKYKGRKAVQIKNFEWHYQRYLTRQISKSALAKELGVSRPTLDKLIRYYEGVPSSKPI